MSMSRSAPGKLMAGSVVITLAIAATLPFLLGQSDPPPAPLEIEGVSREVLEENGIFLTVPEGQKPDVPVDEALTIAEDKGGMGVGERAVLANMVRKGIDAPPEPRLVWIVVLDSSVVPVPMTNEADYVIASVAVVDAATGDVPLTVTEFGACYWGPEFAEECARRGITPKVSPTD